jgi:repressor LexA
MDPIDAARQKARRDYILSFLVGYTERHGYPPSVREIADETGVSVSTIHLSLGELVEAGNITRAPGVSRGIRILIPEPVQ